MLAQRLRELEQAGIVGRRKLAPPAAARVYELTRWGEELEPVIFALGRWGSRTPLPADGEDAVFGVDSVILALKTLYEPNEGARETLVELRLGEQRFQIIAGEDRLNVSRGPSGTPAAALNVSREPSGTPAAIITTDPVALAGLLWHGRSLRGAIRDGDVELEGERLEAERFIKLFPLPEPAPSII